MEAGLIDELQELAKRRGEKVTDIIAKALQVGVSKLWQESILDKYLQGGIEKEQAIKLVGPKLVKLADKQKKIALEDVKWGLHG